MAVCEDSQMLCAAGVLAGMKHRTSSSQDVEMTIDKPQMLRASASHGAKSSLSRFARLRETRRSSGSITPRWIPNSSQLRMWATIFSKSISASNPSVNMLDVIPDDGQSTSSRLSLPVFDSSYGFQRDPVAFAPRINVRAARLCDKVSNRYFSASSMLQSSTLASTHCPAAKTSPIASDLDIPLQDISVEAEKQRLEAQVNELLASLDRDLYGREPRALEPGEDSNLIDLQKESGEISDDQQYGHKVLKRGRGEESARPIKRARRNARREFDMMSSCSRSGKRYYSGPYLEQTPLYQQESYIPVKRLGTGGQGTAHLLKTPRRGSLVVCKVIPHNRDHKYSQSELAFLRDALPPHSRIVKIRSALISPCQTQLYLDYCDGGDLTSFVEKYHYGLQSHYIPESFIWHVFLQLSEALAYIHHGYDRSASSVSGRQTLPSQWLPVIHRDIKPANILLQRARSHPDHPGPEPYPRLVLADFGLALQATEFNVSPTSDYAIGTYAWQPPECPHHSTKGDVWSIGAVIFEMCTGRLPFDEEMPEYVQDVHDFRAWCEALSDAEKQTMFIVGKQGYSDGLDRCLGKALAMEKGERMGSLELMMEVENCRDRKQTRWEELVPWVWGEEVKEEQALDYA
ncbi:MAG: hypothetical protein Q9225_005886 [Loekoesia sp. 1 TL-2023]